MANQNFGFVYKKKGFTLQPWKMHKMQAQFFCSRWMELISKSHKLQPKSKN